MALIIGEIINIYHGTSIGHIGRFFYFCLKKPLFKCISIEKSKCYITLASYLKQVVFLVAHKIGRQDLLGKKNNNKLPMRQGPYSEQSSKW